MQLDLDAYVVLVHAELELYFETLAQWLLDRCESQWIASRGAPTGAVIALAMHYSNKPNAGEHRAFDRVRLFLGEAKTSHSRVITGNHGANVEYVKALLEPLGIDIPAELRLRESLAKLAEHRGARAHGIAAQTVRSARDLKAWADDCLEFSTKLGNTVVAAIP